MMITREQFEQWKSQHITQEVFKAGEDKIDAMKDILISGGAIGKNCEETALMYVGMVGRIMGLQDYLNTYLGEDQPQTDEELDSDN